MSLVTSSTGLIPTASSALTAAAATATECPYQPETVGQDWNWYGCYTEATGARALSSGTLADDDMTLAMCALFCSGYTYFGVEYSRECYCGDKLNAGSVVAGDEECTMICGGSECNYCGAGDRLSIYTTAGDASTPPSGTEVEPTSTTSGGPTAPTGIPDGWDYYGCWVDGAAGRILNYQAPDDDELTTQSCINTCADLGYTIAGAEYQSQCFCGDNIVNGGVKATSEDQCSTPCGGDSDETCGGPDRMSIFSVGEPVVRAAPGATANVGNWTYQGCAQDNVDDKRTFEWQLIYQDTLTPKICTDACAAFGYMAAGMEYGSECYCGDPANMATVGSKFVDDSQCNVACAGDGDAICGGGSLLTTYFWEGDPFYSWTFPEEGSAAAGRYELLIGGVVIPLMTSQAVTGKVTFLEKWGTGPPNSTGAYELDLSVIDDFDAAWRTMHVKTDLFCAGGVTLPDKAGRQLNVGGWSGDSTFGVRLYLPDGSPGVKGTNDWEENADVLKLQDGRWYPSTLNMANGSILVVGGEEGSNSAPVPTLEILPATGTAPLYMDWLERTDPNNLYPFLAVLPSGGIFVAYWNEARILNEDTFSTIKTMPDIPGAVNDAKGGRTYPLEGTAVLLPQHAPYTDPVGVLICGGSTEGPGNALDNCVSIQPDTENPEWVLERMPSKRVMTCMAPLPDGTYLILNGAQHGVAGFGLGTNPNLNALLYDPTKPVGSRITVMANTTVPRLYHSEAITLLDGRVLVSGSDPQDGVNPQEYRVEAFIPPYLLGGKTRPTFTVQDKDWAFEQVVPFTLGAASRNGAITASLLGSVSSTHGNSMGARTLFPAVSCAGTSCTVTAPPGPYICTPGWYQFFVLDGGIPAVGVFVRIGGDPGKIGNWPAGGDFTLPGV
ncbi:Glyoxal oxidase N-terminus [Geosmithia morbida]|uniref:Glyoxal oxidase N-terminus n=1 Tax=Geosmithia morbida TaxID=1094350 RepID=A0A9P4YV96_9HYPO|nr:Glyoxal oxidase N-terminus [Geosmithia morbida]KAF4123465.1 Glyoxal oxidase N-terminus [Geosmithia morbida]